MRTLELSMIMVVIATVAVAASVALILNQASEKDLQTGRFNHNSGNGGYQIQGNLTLKKNSNFMSQESARSLYNQFGFDVKFPSYIPKGFVPLGTLTDLFPSSLTEYFGEKSLLGANFSDTWDKIRSCAHRTCKIITVGASKYIGQNTTDESYRQYLGLLNASSTTRLVPTFSVANGTAIMQPSSNSPTIIIVTRGDEEYLLTGDVSTEELIKMAKSLL